MKERIAEALTTARNHLLSRRHPDGYWEGHLSSSALATATALSALALAEDPRDQPLIEAGLHWLDRTQNADGGWGDTPDSPSNLATTLLVASALRLATRTGGFQPRDHAAVVGRAAAHLAGHGARDSASRAAAISQAYGNDRTFAVPILMNCALTGLVDWSAVSPLPYQLAIFPRSWYKLLRLQVVSYALPALIAVGMAIEHHRPERSVGSAIRRLVTPLVRRKLIGLQPESGGFLEATPLTAFVCMALLSLGLRDDPVVAGCLQFLRASARPDGAWPIDTNLSVWLTSLSCQALAASGGLEPEQAEQTRQWLMRQQARREHPYTGAAPGGWGWSHLSGAVPDADDTAGALLALGDTLDEPSRLAGVEWLLDLQNTDGGWPTFCRGWGQLPFDQSCDDITAHALRALAVGAPASSRRGTAPAGSRHSQQPGLAFLRARQRPDGAWVPLWFGNQAAPDQQNPVLGTARVLRALAQLEPDGHMAARGRGFLLSAQNADGGWGGAAGVPSTVEETALAVSALTEWPDQDRDAWIQGARYLVERTEAGGWTRPAPIGLYFARLWYAEELYPVIWTVEALGKAAQFIALGAR